MKQKKQQNNNKVILTRIIEMLLIILSLIILIMIVNIGTSKAVIDNRNSLMIGDYIFFNPMDESSCTYENYWTNENQNTNCYRWVITNIDEDKNKVEMLLDHNLLEVSWYDLDTKINEYKRNWSQSIENIWVPRADKMIDITKDSFGSTSTDNWETKSSTAIPNQYWINTRSSGNYGFWLANDSSQSTKAYRIDDYGSLGQTEKDKKRGVRPVIRVSASLITTDKEYQTTDVKLNKLFTQKYDNEKYENYKSSQAMAITNSKIFFSVVKGDKDATQLWGVDIDQSKTFPLHSFPNGVSNPHTEYYLGHANGMTYNPNTNLIYVPVINDDPDTGVCSKNGYKNNCIVGINQDTLELKATYAGVFTGLGYDEINKRYIGFRPNNGYILDENFKTIKIFDLPTNGTTQDIFVHGGFVYYIVYTNSKNSGSTFSDPRFIDYTNHIYVYDLDDFKLVEDYFVPKKTDSKFSAFGDNYSGEAESGSFYDLNGDGIDEIILVFNRIIDNERFSFYTVEDTMKPVIENVNIDSSNILSFKAVDTLTGIQSYAITNSNEIPTNWSDVSTSNCATSYKCKFNYNVINNVTYYIWVKDKVGNIGSYNISVSDEGKEIEVPNTGRSSILYVVIGTILVLIGLCVFMVSMKKVKNISR